MTAMKPSAAAAAVGATQVMTVLGRAIVSACGLSSRLAGWTPAAAIKEAVCLACHFGPGPRKVECHFDDVPEPVLEVTVLHAWEQPVPVELRVAEGDPRKRCDEPSLQARCRECAEQE